MPSLIANLTCLAGLSLISLNANATTAQETQELALALKQLAAVEAIIDRAEQQGQLSAASPETRYVFDYGALRADLDRVESGIQQFLTPSRAQPRDAAQLNGSYLNDRGQP